jgi:hypothetical protein
VDDEAVADAVLLDLGEYDSVLGFHLPEGRDVDLSDAVAGAEGVEADEARDVAVRALASPDRDGDDAALAGADAYERDPDAPARPDLNDPAVRGDERDDGAASGELGGEADRDDAAARADRELSRATGSAGRTGGTGGTSRTSRTLRTGRTSGTSGSLRTSGTGGTLRARGTLRSGRTGDHDDAAVVVVRVVVARERQGRTDDRRRDARVRVVRLRVVAAGMRGMVGVRRGVASERGRGQDEDRGGREEDGDELELELQRISDG